MSNQQSDPPPRPPLRRCSPLAVFAFSGAGDPATRFKEIGHQLMCICSCGQILLECNHVGCPDSDGMRNELMAAVTRGDSDSLVEQAFVQKYGPTVLAAPTTTGFDRTAWIFPFVAFGLGRDRSRIRRSRLEEPSRPRRRRWRLPPSGALISTSSASRLARRPTYDIRMGLLHSGLRRFAALHLSSARTSSISARTRLAPHISASAKTPSTKICAT